MPAAALSQPEPPATDPALRLAMAELLQMSLKVARLSAHLAEVQDRALAVVEDAAVEAARRLVAIPTSLAEAIEAGTMADASDEALDVITARAKIIVDMNDKASRAVRRTVALTQRLDEGRPVRARVEARTPAQPIPQGAGDDTRAPERDPAERRDYAELDDEIDGLTDEQAIRAICRDVAIDPAPYLDLLSDPPLPPALHAAASVPAHSAPPATPAHLAMPAAPRSGTPPTTKAAAPEPDT